MWASLMMARVIVLVMMAVCVSLARSSSECAPSCTDKAPGSKIQDPENCRRYFVCLEDELPSDSSIECPTGEYFHNSSIGCNAFKPASCRPCSHCRTRCSDSINDLISNPMDCHSFFICIFDSLVKSTCGTQYFNGISCSTDENSCCDPCFVYCPTEGIEVYDPYDCTMYYLCEEEGVPEESHHLQCPPENPRFDRELHRCGLGDISCMDDANQSINPCPWQVEGNGTWVA